MIEREDLKLMKPGSVIIDVAVDQGGCVETTQPTTHSDPTYVVDDVLHYCVANMPGAVGRTSTFALCNVTLPWALQIANRGILPAAEAMPPVARAINLFEGEVTNRAVAETFGMKYNPRFESRKMIVRGVLVREVSRESSPRLCSDRCDYAFPAERLTTGSPVSQGESPCPKQPRPWWAS